MVSGIYVVFHATKPRHVYIGEAVDCRRRNQERSLLGLHWRIVRKMPGSTQNERRAAERAIADGFARRGYVVLSKNTAAAIEATRLRRVGKVQPPHVIALLRSMNIGRKHTAATKRKISRALKGRTK